MAWIINKINLYFIFDCAHLDTIMTSFICFNFSDLVQVPALPFFAAKYIGLNFGQFTHFLINSHLFMFSTEGHDKAENDQSNGEDPVLPVPRSVVDAQEHPLVEFVRQHHMVD